MNAHEQIFNIYNNTQKSIQFRHCQTLSLKLLEVVCRGMITRMARIQWIECGGSLISGQVGLIKDSVGLKSWIPPAQNNRTCFKKMIWMLMIKELTYTFAVSITIASRVNCQFYQFSIKWPPFHFSFKLLDSLQIALMLLGSTWRGCHIFLRN